MRTIKFRGKRLYDGKWVYGYVLGHDTLPYMAIVTMNNTDKSVINKTTTSVEPDTIGQFTGLYDKNGKEIYEGDIIEHPYVDPIFRDLVETKEGDGVTSEVVFHDGAFVVKYDENNFIYLDAFTRHGHVEVISNIHDNLKLL